MDRKPLMEAVERRAFDCRTPLTNVCKAAGVSPNAATRWGEGLVPSLTTIGKLERALDRIEAERAL